LQTSYFKKKEKEQIEKEICYSSRKTEKNGDYRFNHGRFINESERHTN